MSSRAKALIGAGALALRLGDPGTAWSRLEEGLACHRALGDQRQVAYALNNLGNVTARRGDYAAARTLHTECLALRRERRDR